MTTKETELRSLLAYALAALAFGKDSGERQAVRVYIESELDKLDKPVKESA